MSDTKQVEPCVSLSFAENDGVTLTVAAQLRQGAQNWTPEEAGVWFFRTWQKSLEVLTAMTAYAALAVGATLVRQGELAWSVSPLAASKAVPERMPAPTPEPELILPQAEAALVIPVVNQELAPPLHAVGPRRFEDPASEEGAGAEAGIADEITDDEAPNGVAAPRIPESAAQGVDEKKVVRHLNRSGRPMSVSDLKRETGLSEYRVRKAIEALGDKGLVGSEMVPGKGRWKEQAVYSGSGSR